MWFLTETFQVVTTRMSVCVCFLRVALAAGLGKYAPVDWDGHVLKSVVLCVSERQNSVDKTE